MKSPVVVLDACALVPIRLATTLLWLAEAGLFQPLWSDQILDEVERNLPKLGVEPAQAKRRVSQMRDAFGAEALVEDFDDLIERMTCDPKDRHVLAAAVHDEADALVTFNLKDFPVEASAPYGIEILHPDLFLLGLLNERPTEVIEALDARVQDLRRPAQTLTEWLAGLTGTVPVFANLAADELNAPAGPVTELPALVQADEDEVAASMGAPGDFTNPAQVAFLWFCGLFDELAVTRALTYSPAGWGDYRWAQEDLKSRSLASRVINAVDAPGQIVFMRFVPKVGHTAQAFQSFVTEMTFVTLVMLDDKTWRVWGLGPALLPATQILGEGWGQEVSQNHR